MKIAAEQIGTDLKVFIEGANWNKATSPFITEVVKIGLVAYIIDGEPIFHDAESGLAPDTHPSLMFCQEEQSLADFNKKLKKAGYGEPYEIRINNSRFSLKKEFTDAYTLSCYNFCNNTTFDKWLAFLPTLEVANLLQRLKDDGRYFSTEFSEFSEFKNLDDFVTHRFNIWHEETVKGFEDALLKGKAYCPGCNI